MNFYKHMLAEDRLWQGLDAPRPSTSSLLLDLARMEERGAEEKAERKARLDAALEKCAQIMCGKSHG